MGTKGANMVARPPAAGVKMLDLAEWLKDIKREHGVDVRIEMSLMGYDELAMWRFQVSAVKPTDEGQYDLIDARSLVWPTASHKTVLGALLWLIIGVSDSIDADRALAGKG